MTHAAKAADRQSGAPKSAHQRLAPIFERRQRGWEFKDSADGHPIRQPRMVAYIIGHGQQLAMAPSNGPGGVGGRFLPERRGDREQPPAPPLVGTPMSERLGEPQSLSGAVHEQPISPTVGSGGHTPGPWTSSGDTVFRNAQLNGVVADCDVGSASTAERVANAHLIAAAPDLLSNERKNLATMEETVRRLVRHGLSHDELDLAIEQTRAAISRAEGR